MTFVPPGAEYSMAYIAPIHRASSVRHALKLSFLDPDEECLAVAKSNRLEFHALTSEGLVLRHQKIVYGQIVMLEKLRPSSATTDHLFVGTDRHMYFTLSWSQPTRQLVTEQSFEDLSDPNGRDSQSRDRCFVDPLRKFITLELHEGVLTVLPVHTKQPKNAATAVDIGNLTGEFLPIRIPEILVRSSTYLNYKTTSEKEKARIATLFEDNQEKAYLKVRTLVPSKDLDYAELEDDTIVLKDNLDPTASHLIPVPNPVNGLLVLSETRITWSDGGGEYKIHPLQSPISWCAWTHIEDWRWLLADEYGGLHFLMLEWDEIAEKVLGFQLHKLEKRVSTPSTLVYLGNGFVYVGSHSGDSQVVKLSPETLSVLQTFPNIAPIVDVAIMDMGSRGGGGQINEYSSGQARLVTGSGAWQDGSLRSVRSGVGVEEIGSIELTGVEPGTHRAATEMFHIKLDTGSQIGDLLFVSYVDNTRMFLFGEEGSVEEMQCMVTTEPTILAQTLPETRQIVQCTSGNVTVYDQQGLRLRAHWKVPGAHKIVAASASEHHIVLSLGGSELVVLDLANVGQNVELAVLCRRQFEDQISCLSVPKIVSRIILVGFWQSTSLSILSVTDLSDMGNTVISDDPTAVPRSVLLTQVLQDHPPTLFVSLADGHVVTFFVDKSFRLSGRQATILGTQQASLKILPRDGDLCSVFAIAEHSTLIYGSENRLIYSAVTAEDATCICSFDSQTYPNAVALATPSEIKIAQVERERTTHVQTLPIGETVRRIAYSPELRVFGLGTVKRTIQGNAEVVTSYFRLADEINFKTLSQFKCNNEEVVETVCRMEVDENGRKSERFVIGTCYMDDEPDKSRGRIIVFEITEDKALKEVTEVKLKGACRALAIIDGKIVAALTKSVVIFGYEFEGLQKKAGYRTATEPIDCYVNGDHIVISDLMKSVSVLKYERGNAGGPDKLTEIARHHQIVWSTAVAPIDEHTILQSDAEGNLIVLSRNVSGITDDDKRRLETISEMRLGEMVNKIKAIDIPATQSAIVVPRAFMATVNGSIYLFGVIRPSHQNLLMTLQSNIAKLVESPGKVPWEKWRAFKNEVREESEPLRFIDGELIEIFLETDTATQEKMVEGLDVGVEEVKIMVESLRRMH